MTIKEPQVVQNIQITSHSKSGKRQKDANPYSSKNRSINQETYKGTPRSKARKVHT